MRTTLTLDSDVEQLLKEAAHRERKPFKEVVNEAIRRGLSPGTRRASRRLKLSPPHHCRLVDGIDPAGFNRLVDELDDEQRAQDLCER